MVKILRVVNFYLGTHDRRDIGREEINKICEYLRANAKVDSIIGRPDGVYACFYIQVPDYYTDEEFYNSSFMKKINGFKEEFNLHLRMLLSMGDESSSIESGNIDYSSQITIHLLSKLGIDSLPDEEYNEIRSEISCSLENIYQRIKSKYNMSK